MCRQLAFVEIRQHLASGSVQDSQRRFNRLPMDTGISTCSDGWIRSEKRVHAGTFSLSGISCGQLSLQNAISPEELREIEDPVFAFALSTWKSLSFNVEPFDGIRHIQRAWDIPVANSIYLDLQARCVTPADKARLRAVAAPHAGDWLNVLPLTLIGLRLSNEAVRVAAGFRLGCTTCQPHICICGATVDARGLHGISCGKSRPKHIRHSPLNDLIWRAVNRAQISATKKPIDLS